MKQKRSRSDSCPQTAGPSPVGTQAHQHSCWFVIPDDRKWLHPGLHVPRGLPGAEVPGAPRSARGECAPSPCTLKTTPHLWLVENGFVNFESLVKLSWSAGIGILGVSALSRAWRACPATGVSASTGRCAVKTSELDLNHLHEMLWRRHVQSSLSSCHYHFFQERWYLRLCLLFALIHWISILVFCKPNGIMFP